MEPNAVVISVYADHTSNKSAKFHYMIVKNDPFMTSDNREILARSQYGEKTPSQAFTEALVKLETL